MKQIGRRPYKVGFISTIKLKTIYSNFKLRLILLHGRRQRKIARMKLKRRATCSFCRAWRHSFAPTTMSHVKLSSYNVLSFSFQSWMRQTVLLDILALDWFTSLFNDLKREQSSNVVKRNRQMVWFEITCILLSHSMLSPCAITAATLRRIKQNITLRANDNNKNKGSIRLEALPFGCQHKLVIFSQCNNLRWERQTTETCIKVTCISSVCCTRRIR